MFEVSNVLELSSFLVCQVYSVSFDVENFDFCLVLHEFFDLWLMKMMMKKVVPKTASVGRGQKIQKVENIVSELLDLPSKYLQN